VPGDEACNRSVTHACTSLERAAGTFLAPTLVAAMDLIKTYRALPRCRGDRRPNPGALGNSDLVVVVGVGPVNLLASSRSVRTTLAHAVGGVPPMARDVRVGLVPDHRAHRG
jgi:hypothetical protein